MPAVLSGSNVTVTNNLKLGQFPTFKSDGVGSDTSTGIPVFHPDISNACLDGRWDLIWALKKKGLLSLRLLMRLMALLFLTFVVSAWYLEVALVLPFAGVGVLLAMVAAIVYTKHVTDQDFIGLREDILCVETHRGGHVLRWDFNPRWVRIEPRDANGSLIRVSGHGKFVDVGRYLRDDLRLQLASELRWAIRQFAH